MVAAGVYWVLTPGKPLAPVIDVEESPGHPVLLASALVAARGVDKLPPFRGADSSGRGLQANGIVTSLEGGEANINLGSLDGLSKGSEVQVFRNQQLTQPIARLTVTAVFRERARARPAGEEAVRVNDHVRVSGVEFLHAMMEQADAYAMRDDLTAARDMADRSITWAESARVPPGERRQAVEHLAAIQYRAGMTAEAESHFRWVVENLNAEPAASPAERADAWNSLAVLHILKNETTDAQRLLGQVHLAPGASGVGFARCANNLGVLAELGGDRRKAERFYADALRAFGSAPETPTQDRRAIQTNLVRIKGSH
jgi:Flp pilus assembly protein TadD